MHPDTIAIHAARIPDPVTGAIAPPIHLSTTFQRAEDGSYPQGFDYIRSDNPTRQQLEQALAAMEGGTVAAAFSSGSAATMAVLQTLKPGDHAIAPVDAYSGTGKLLRTVLMPWGLQVSFVDMTDLTQVHQAMQPNTKLLWVETPSNPLLKISDIAALATLSHENGAVCVCDNTWATPMLQRPLELGADLVVHSTTKYFGGHSDVLGGAVMAAEDTELFQKVRHVQTTGGAVASPFDSWLVLRGMQTLPCRMRVHCANAQRIAEFLAHHPTVEQVHYPGLEQHSGHAIARRQMSGFGGMLSVQVYGGREAAFAIAAQVKLFTRATSLGGVESLLEHRASIEGPDSQTPDNLLRLSIGLEYVDDLIADLDQAMTATGKL
jgi:cystathionine gamma-synthase